MENQMGSNTTLISILKEIKNPLGNKDKLRIFNHLLQEYHRRIRIAPPAGWIPSDADLIYCGYSFYIGRDTRQLKKHIWGLRVGIITDAFPFYTEQECRICHRRRLVRHEKFVNPQAICRKDICYSCLNYVNVSKDKLQPINKNDVDMSTLPKPDFEVYGWNKIKQKDDKAYYRDDIGFYHGLRLDGVMFYCRTCHMEIADEEVLSSREDKLLVHSCRGHYHPVAVENKYVGCRATYCPICDKAVIDPSSFNGYCSKECQITGLQGYANLIGVDVGALEVAPDGLEYNKAYFEKMRLIKERNNLNSRIRYAKKTRNQEAQEHYLEKLAQVRKQIADLEDDNNDEVGEA